MLTRVGNQVGRSFTTRRRAAQGNINYESSFFMYFNAPIMGYPRACETTLNKTQHYCVLKYNHGAIGIGGVSVERDTPRQIN